MKKLHLLVMAVTMVGCTTTPDGEANDWDWSTQTGTFTFDQAKIEFGTPFYTRPSGDGGTVAVWRVVTGWTYSSRRLIESRPQHAILHFDKDGKLVSGSGFGPRKKEGKNQ